MKKRSMKSEAYIEVLRETWPLIVVAFIVGCLRAWSHVKRSYLQEHFWPTVLNIVVSSAFMAVVAVGITLALPLVGIEISPELEVGVVTLISGMGMKTFDAYIRKKAGFVISEKTDSGVEK